MSSIFRPAALNAQQTKWLGDIVMIRPVSFAFLTAFAGIIALLVVSFLTWGSYTKRSTVSGQLIPVTGLVKVFAPQPGIVLEKHVLEGQRVNKGDVLYVLSSERQSSRFGNTQEAINTQVEARKQSLRDELDLTKAMQVEEREALVKKISGLEAELKKLDSQISVQKSRVALSVETRSRYEGLLRQDYISKEQLQQKQEELLDQRYRLQGQERDRIAHRLQIQPLPFIPTRRFKTLFTHHCELRNALANGKSIQPDNHGLKSDGLVILNGYLLPADMTSRTKKTPNLSLNWAILDLLLSI